MKTTIRQSPAWRLLSAIASLKLTVIGLSLLLILTVWGTIYQVDSGLYQAQQRFFRSWFFLAGGFLPFPGGQLVMAVMLANLVAACTKLTFQGRMQIGLLLTHAGLILMLGAGAVTFYLGFESNLTLFEGEGANVSTSNSDWEIAIWPRPPEGTTRDIAATDAATLHSGDKLSVPGSGIELVVEDYFPHAEAFQKPEENASREYTNGSGIMSLRALPRRKEPSEDRPGLMALVRSNGKDVANVLLWGGDTHDTVLTIDGRQIGFELRRKRFLLPTTIKLVDFKMETHPGIDMASSYSSKVIVSPGSDAERAVTISMNKPLRIDNFTFYQASYSMDAGGREGSTLAVVKNFGRTMPYVATMITFGGMLLHFIGRLLHRIKHLRQMEARS